MIKIKRIYDARETDDGIRVLVERLWPRGVSKEAANLDAWLREIAPSDSLRKWYGHEPAKWDEFQKAYLVELQMPERTAALKSLMDWASSGNLTLLYAAKDTLRNSAVVLQGYLNTLL
jgi:uncharacterized protein YeaO (DUF488 family)